MEARTSTWWTWVGLWKSLKAFGSYVLDLFRKLRGYRVPHPDIEVRHVENQEELIKWLRVNAKLLTPLHSFYRGIALGFGLAIGTGVVLSLLVHLLTRLALVPLIGDFAKEILDYLGSVNGGS